MNLKKLLTPVVLGLSIFIGSLLPSRANAQYLEGVISTGMGSGIKGVAYIAGSNSLCLTSKNDLGIFSLDSNKLVSKIPVKEISSAPVYNSRDNKVYCSFGYYSDSLLCYNLSNNLEKRIRPGDVIVDMHLDEKRDRLYTIEWSEVSVIDCKNDSVLAHIRVPDPEQISISRNKLYIPSWDEGVKIVDPDNFQIIKTLYTGDSTGDYGHPFGLFYEDVNKYYVCGGGSRNSWIQVIDGTTDATVKKIPFPSYKCLFFRMLNGNLALIENDSVFVLNPYNDSLISGLDEGESNESNILQSKGSGLIYLGKRTLNPGNLSVLNNNATSLVASFYAGRHITGLAYGNRRVYATNELDDNLCVIKDPVNELPERWTLVYPNPSKENVTIRFQEPVQNEDVSVVSLEGKVVNTLSSPSQNEFHWNGFDANGRNVPAGVYFVRRKSGEMAKVIRSK